MGISLRNILLLGLCVSLGACAFKKEDSEDKQRQQLADDVAKKIQDDKDNSKIALRNSNIKVEFKERDLGYYDFVVSWPEAIGRMEVVVNNAPADEVKGRNSFKRTVSQGDEISFKLRAYESSSIGGAFIGEFEDVAYAPKDFLIYRTIELSRNLVADEINRAYIRQDAKIITNGYDFTLNAKSLYIEEVKDYAQSGNPVQFSQIITNSNSEPSTENRISQIQITANHAKGKLFVAMIGRDGMDGKNGAELETLNGLIPLSTSAENGSNGTGGVLSIGKLCPPTRNKDVQCEPVPPKCMQPPSNGQDGKEGKNGYDGENGQAGRNTGDLKIQIENFQDFSLEIYQKPGKGGRGGLGTPGQLGGKGGIPGDNRGICPSASAGKNGKNGEPGRNGKDGADGSKGLIETNVRPRII